MRKTFPSVESGFTLLEVVFAVSILAIGMMGYTALKISNRFSWAFARDLTQSLQLTGANLEGLRMAGYNDGGWMTAGTHSQTSVNDAGATPLLQSGDFTASGVAWTVREGCPSPMAKMVTLTTNWNTGGNKELTLTQVQVRNP